MAAWQLAYGTSSSTAVNSARDKSAATLATLLICRAHVHEAAQVSLSWDGTPDTLPGLLQAGLSRFPAAASVLRVSYRREHVHHPPHAKKDDATANGGDQPHHHPSSSPFFLLLRRRAARMVLPEYHALCGDPAVSGTATSGACCRLLPCPVASGLVALPVHGWGAGPALRRMEEILEDLTLPVGR